MEHGIDGGAGAEYVKNNIVINSGSSDYNDVDFSLSGNNISSDGSAPGSNSLTNANVTFADEANDNFHLAPNDTTAIDAGTSTPLVILSGANGSRDITHDIDGNYRRSIDIGADEASINFDSTVMESGGEFSSLSAWEAANQVDLAATTTAVFSIASSTGWIPVGSSVTGATSGATASTTVVATSSMKILLYNISGTFVSGEDVQFDGVTSNAVELADAGNPAIAVAKIDGAWSTADETAIEIDGWTTGDNNYIKVYTTESARHNGKWDDNKYRLEITDGHGIYTYEDNLRIEGLQISLLGTAGYRYGIINEDSVMSNVFVSSNIIKDGESIDYRIGIRLIGTFRNFSIYNNMVYDFSGTDSRSYYLWSVNDGEIKLYNNTFYNNYQSYVSWLDVIGVNNIYQECGLNCVDSTTSFYTGSGFNITSEGGTIGTNSQTNTTVQFVDAANDDFHLSSSDTAARNAGTTTTGDINYWYDIDGTARGFAWDIGADELPTTYTSIICEDTSAGGNCADMDYSSLSDWEDAVETNLASSSTRVFGGSITGSLNENDQVWLFDASGTSTASGYVVATTSDQILIDGIVGSSTLPVTASTSYVWQLDASNYWTVTGTGDDFGASAQVTAEIDGVWTSADTALVDIYGWTTDNDNFIKVYTASAARHIGKWNDTKYRYQGTNALRLTESYVKVDGLQTYNLSTGSWVSGIETGVAGFPAGDSEVTISNNIVRGNHTTGTNNSGIRLGTSHGPDNGVANIYNNIIYNWGAAQNIEDTNFQSWHIYNNTIVGTSSGYGLYTVGNTIAKNNIVSGFGDTRAYLGTFLAGTDYNATDGTDSIGTGGNNIVSATINFVNTASGTEDFHLKEGSSLINAGIDLSSTSTLNFLTDIDSGTRNVDGLGWDIGADEVATKLYRSVGNDSSDLSNSATLTISGRTATFSASQPDNIGVGDVIQFGGAGYYDLAFITARASSTEYSVQAWDGSAPTATTTAAMGIYRAHLELNDWEGQTVGQVNASIDDTIDDTILVGQDLVASNTIMMVACYAADTVDDAFVQVRGWGTGAQNYIKIYTPYATTEVGVSQRHNGKWDDDKYSLEIEANSDFDEAVYLENIDSDSYIEINGLQIFMDSKGYRYGTAIQYDNNTYGKIFNNIIKGNEINAGENQRGISDDNSGDRSDYFYIANNIIYDFIGSGGMGIYVSFHGESYLYNNTVYNCQTGIGGNQAYYIAINNIVQDSIVVDYENNDFLSGSYNNLSSDGSADDDASMLYSITNADVTFVDEANDNFHLAPSDTAAIDAGTSTLSFPASVAREGNPGDYDIDGNFRRSHDIGADEASINFDSTVMESGGEFTSLSAWEAANQVDLAATTTAVFSIASSTGWIPVGSSVTGATSGATASTTVVATSSMKILLYNISGTFVSGEDVQLDGATSNAVELSDAGNPAIAVAKIDGAWSAADGFLDVDGFTTGPNNYVRIYTTEAARHNGVWNDGKYRMEYNDRYGDSTIIQIYDDYVRIDGLQIHPSYDGLGGTDYQEGILVLNTGAEISNCIIKKLNTGNRSGIMFEAIADNGEIKIYNNIIYDFYRALRSNNRYSSIKHKASIFNNTLIDSFIAMRYTPGYGDDVYLYNNLVQDGVNNDYFLANINTSNNLSSDSTSPDGSSFQNANVSFVDEDNYDFHLSTTDTVAKNNGTSSVLLDSGSSSLRSSSGMTSDIDGDTRYDYGVDIGADEAPTVIYRSVGRHEGDLAPASTTVTIADNTATFSNGMPDNVGVGDILQIGTNTPYQLAVIGGRTSTTTFTVTDKDGAGAAATSSAPVSVFRAHRLLDDWEDQVPGDVNQAIDASLQADVLVNQDLTASNTAMFVPCYASTTADDTTVNIGGWTTATSTYIKIYAPVGSDEVGVSQRHSGVWDDTKFRIDHAYTGSLYGRIIDLADNFVNIKGLQIRTISSTTGGIVGIRGLGDGKYIILNNIIDLTNSSNGGGEVIGMQGNAASDADVYIYNNIMIGHTNTEGIGIQAYTSQNTYIYNNTIYNWATGITSTNGTTSATNNAVFGNNDDFFGTITLNYNASDDGDGTNAIDLSPASFATEADAWAAAFTDYANGDFSIRDIYSPLFDSGETITIVDDDILGNARPYYEAYDVGAFEYYSGKAKYRFSPGGNFKMKGTIKFK